jgi:hypothetical protein
MPEAKIQTGSPSTDQLPNELRSIPPLHPWRGGQGVRCATIPLRAIAYAHPAHTCNTGAAHGLRASALTPTPTLPRRGGGGRQGAFIMTWFLSLLLAACATEDGSVAVASGPFSELTQVSSDVLTVHAAPRDALVHPWPRGGMGRVALSPCGDVAALLVTVVDGDRALVVKEWPVDGKERTQELFIGALPGLGEDAAIVYDADCAPQVLAVRTQGVERWQGVDGVFAGGLLPLSLEEAGVAAPSELTLLEAARDVDARLHLVLEHADVGLLYALEADGAWTIARADPLPGLMDLAVDADGVLHAVHADERALAWSRLDGEGWATEIVDDLDVFDDHPALDATIAASATGRLAIAATHARSGSSGSYRWMRLELHERLAGAWTRTTLVDRADGYAGADGEVYTGGDPALAFDGDGAAHVVFTDVAHWHIPLDIGDGQIVSAQDSLGGQLRYAFEGPKGWEAHTLYTQAAPVYDAPPMLGLTRPDLLISQDGRDLSLFGQALSVSGASLRYDAAAPIELRGLLVRVARTR